MWVSSPKRRLHSSVTKENLRVFSECHTGFLGAFEIEAS